MTVKRSSRRVAAWSALIALFFAQVCLAAYACPLALPAEASAAAMSPACDGEMPQQPDAACETHCREASAPASAVQAPTVAILDIAPLIVAAPDVLAFASRLAPSDEVTTNATAPPAAIRFCRFLI